MKLISHRGNLNGRHIERENEPQYIREALDRGFDVEIDVWYINGKYMLGHDEPIHDMPLEFIQDNRLWFHCKNGGALEQLSKYYAKHFYHISDDYTLTSNGKIWTYVGAPLLKNSICVLPEVSYDGKLENCYGICSDKIDEYKRYEGV